MGIQTLYDFPKYRSFIQERDKALEQIHLNTQIDLSRMLFEALDSVDRAVSQLVLRSQIHSSFVLAQSLEHQTLDTFNQLIYPMVHRIQCLRRASYTLSHLGELEAIGQATQRQTKQKGFEFKQRLKQVDWDKTLTGQKIEHRVWLSLMRIREKILSAFRYALIQELTPQEIVEIVKDSFPKIQVYKRPPRTLKPIREAAKGVAAKKEFSIDFIDQDDWNLVQQAYTGEELPKSRFDQEAHYDPETGHARYDWEVEQELTDDFVNQVRKGQIDAANDLGIQDFVWIAVIDQKTCEVCCIPRNGKLVSEIASDLESGKLNKLDCDAITPPAHPNCRCTLGPVASIDPVAGPDWKSFNEWIDS